MPEDGSGVIDPDVLWSCVTCGACVQQCPVDIEHVDHIVDMRRYQVLVESNFPAELNQLFKGMENKGNPWNMSPTARMDWAKGLDFEVKVVGDDIESLDEVEWLFWVGCAGAYEDRAKKTTRAVAELLDIAGVSFGVLGNGETCTGDSARRAGNEFVFQGLAQQNVETFKEYKVKKVVSTCAHCFNTLKNEYKDFGIELEVVHHTQLLNRLVREGKLTPVPDGVGAAPRSITYHDPCYIGRHNGVYSPPRELLQVLPGAEFKEMPRNSEKSFCCGAGGARMWMEETIGTRINENRTAEAVGTGADQIAVGCPFCRVMLSDGLTSQQAKGEAREEVEVLDVAQMLLASVRGESATKVKAGVGAAAPAAKKSEQTKAEPEPGDVTQTENTVTETADVGPAAKASGGSSLFDLGGDEPEAKTEPEKKAAEPASSGGSLFDIGGDEPEAKSEPESTPAEPVETKKAAEPASSGGSLFDIATDEPEAKSEPEKKPAEPARPRRTSAPAAHSSTSPPMNPRPRANPNPRRPSPSRPRRTSAPAAHSSTSPPTNPRPRANRNPRRPSPSSAPEAGTRSRAGRRDPPGRLPLRHPSPGTRSGRHECAGARAGSRGRAGTHAGRACRGPGRSGRARLRPEPGRRPQPGRDRRGQRRRARGRGEPEPEPERPSPSRTTPRTTSRRRRRRRSRSRPAAVMRTSRRPTSTSMSRVRSSTSDAPPPTSYR